MVSNTVRVAIGILGNGASMLLYAAPLYASFPEVKDMTICATYMQYLSLLLISYICSATLVSQIDIQKGGVEEFSCVPYILALFNCLLYTWYGLPVVSSGWENFPVSTINGLGILLEITFISIYIWFAPREKKRFALQLVLPVMTFFGFTACFSAFFIHTHHMRKVVVGSVGLVASVSMYSSPMVAAKQVIATKSVEFMPFYLSLFSFLSSALWMVYGLLGRDFFIASPNFVGCPMGLLQLVLYCIYRQRSDDESPDEKPRDIEQQENGHAPAEDSWEGARGASEMKID